MGKGLLSQRMRGFIGIFLTSAFLFLSLVGLYVRYAMDDSFALLPKQYWLPKIKVLEKIDTYSQTDSDYRLVFIGDVHGQYNELMNLIDGELGGLDESTTIVLLGDFISKGPDSEKVVSYILNNRDNVKCVLGNHDLAVMFAYMNPQLNHLPLGKIREELIPLNFTYDKSFYPKDITKVKKMHSLLAKELGFEKLKQLALHSSIALEYELPDQSLFAVHAGMLPGDFRDRTPTITELTEMKYVDSADWSQTSKDKESTDSIRWYELWNDDKIADSYKSTTILYGHDAKSGLNLREHTKGLDSGCVKGGRLSALEYKYNHKKGSFHYSLFQTDCLEHVNSKQKNKDKKGEMTR